MRVYNFSAGPSMLPEEVLKKAQSEFLDYKNTGMSITEMSHRSKAYDEVISETQSLLREIMGISDNYYVLFLQGGASLQFEAVPLNLLSKGKADYIITGQFAEKAFEESKKYGDMVAAASSKDKNFTYIPDIKYSDFRTNIDYVHFTSNNTIFGTRFTRVPDAPAPLVCDMSSNILSEVTDVSKYGVIYAGAQKNIAPAGVTIVIVKKELADKGAMPICPTMLKYSVMAKNDSMYNTPPCFSIYVAGLVFKWLKDFGGVKSIQKQNEFKAGLIYDMIDNSNFYTSKVEAKDRSIMNIPFVTPSEALDEKFIKEAASKGLVTLKGHRSVGGMRASIYNAMPVEGVKALVEFMKKFEKDNK